MQTLCHTHLYQCFEEIQTHLHSRAVPSVSLEKLSQTGVAYALYFATGGFRCSYLQTLGLSRGKLWL